jgi:polysaccharide deacetylase family protein (PEP-CTERM system associated)
MPTSRNQRVDAHILTVDVEDWFHLLEVKGGYSHADWDTLPSRVVANTERLLALFEEHRLRATFFFIGWIAERNPDLVRRIVEAGHEVGSHSYWHDLVARHDRASFRQDLERSRKVLEDITGAPVRGFRAPGFSITPDTAWAFDVIVEQGFTYDSSLWPGRSIYGGFATPLDGPHLLRCGAGELIEIPASTRVLGVPLPYSGGGYLRLLPEWLIRSCIGANGRRGIPTALYVHPRDFDERQPRIQLPAVRTFRSYVGLASAQRKLRGLLQRFQWVSAGAWIDKYGESVRARLLDVRSMAAVNGPLSSDTREPSPPPPSRPA